MALNWMTIIGLFAATLTTFSFLPQTIKIIKTKETKDISLLMYIILVAGFLLWLAYGFLTKDIPIVIANVVALVFWS